MAIEKNGELGTVLSSIHPNLKLWKVALLVQDRWLLGVYGVSSVGCMLQLIFSHLLLEKTQWLHMVHCLILTIVGQLLEYPGVYLNCCTQELRSLASRHTTEGMPVFASPATASKKYLAANLTEDVKFSILRKQRENPLGVLGGTWPGITESLFGGIIFWNVNWNFFFCSHHSATCSFLLGFAMNSLQGEGLSGAREESTSWHLNF